MTRTAKRATKEQHAAAEYLGSFDDSLARWVQSTGPIDAYDAQLSVTVGIPLGWFSFAITSRQLSRASSLVIYHRLAAQIDGVITAERVVPTDEQTLRNVGLSSRKSGTEPSPFIPSSSASCVPTSPSERPTRH